MKNPDAADALVRAPRFARSVFGVADATNAGARLVPSPHADAHGLPWPGSENLDPPGQGGHPWATGDITDEGIHESKGEREIKGPLSPAMQAFMQPSARRAQQRASRPPVKDQFGASSSNTLGDNLSAASSSSSSQTGTALQPLDSQAAQAYELRLKRQAQRLSELGSDVSSTSSAGLSLPGQGHGSSSSGTSGASSPRQKAPVHGAIAGPVRFRDDFLWATESSYRLDEFDQWLQIPAARAAINNHLEGMYAPEIVQFLDLCDVLVEAQRVDSKDAVDGARRSRLTPVSYKAIGKFLDQCFNSSRVLVLNVHGAKIAALREAFAKLLPNEDLTWSGPMSNLIKEARIEILNQTVIPTLTPKLKADIAVAVQDNGRRLAEADAAAANVQLRRPTLLGALLGHKKPPTPGAGT